MGYHYIYPSLEQAWRLSEKDRQQMKSNICCKTCVFYRVSNECRQGERIVDANLHYCKNFNWYKRVRVRNK